MIYPCSVCQEDVDGDGKDVTFCGYCSVVGHNACLQIQKAVSKVLRGHSDVRWFCGICSNHKLHELIKTNSKLSETVEQLIEPFTDMNSILKKIEELSTNVVVLNNRIAAQQELMNNGSFCSIPNPKRLRSGHSKPVSQSMPATSSPVAVLDFDEINFNNCSPYTPAQQQQFELQKQEAQRQNFLKQQQVYIERHKEQYIRQQQLMMIHKPTVRFQQQRSTGLIWQQQNPQQQSQIRQQQTAYQQNQQQIPQQLIIQVPQQQQQQSLQPQQLQQLQQQHTIQVPQQQQQEQQVQPQQLQQQKQFDQHQQQVKSQQLQQQEKQQVQPQPQPLQQPHYNQELITGHGISHNESGFIHAAQRVKHRFLYVSELHPATTAVQMNEYVSSKLNVPSSDVISQILIKKDKNLEELEFVSFKIGIKENVIEYALENDFWPTGVVVRDFQQQHRRSRSRSRNA